MQGPDPKGPEGESVDDKPTEAEILEENKKVRRLQFLVNLVMNTISQGDLPVEEASELVANTKRAALNLFPDKELAYDLIYKPRLQRLMVEKYRII
jgi:hypothetical protein